MKVRALPLVLALIAGSAVAETRAVLVGVGDYLHLDADLKGPVNDVGLMADTLIQRGVAAAQIVVLADAEAEVPNGVTRGAPDRAQILEALGAAISEAKAGDTVVFYFSGHGAQAPDTNGDEGGGMDEIFLPRDTKGWNGGAGAVENAIVDDELSAFTQMAADRGVKLVAIIDACHSGTGFRAGPQEASRARYISPALLGVPEDDAEVRQVTTPAPPGDYVFLYAAQSDQRAFEYPVGEDSRWHGDFTRALTQVMLEAPQISYTALVEAAAARMRRNAGQAAQTPDLEGPLADSPVLGGTATGLARIAVNGQTLEAGILRGVTPDSIVTLYADRLATNPAGQARVTGVRATQSDLEYIPPIPAVRVTHAELTQRAVDTSVSLHVTPEAAAQLGDAALSAWVDVPLESATPSHLLIWAEGAFALVGADGVLDPNGPGSSIRLGSGPIEALAQNIARAVGRLRLEKALVQMGQGGAATSGFSLGMARGPQVQFTLAPGRLRGRRCAPTDTAGVTADGRAEAANCDVLGVSYANTTAQMQDVTVLYINGDSSVETLWPTRNLSNRIEVAGKKVLRFALQAGKVPLHEAVIVISVPAEPGSARTRLALPGSGAATGALGTYLAQVTDPAQTRGFSLRPKGADIDVARLELTLMPIQQEND